MRSLTALFLAVSLLPACDPTLKCDPGEICTWYGIPQVAGLAEDGTHKEVSKGSS